MRFLVILAVLLLSPFSAAGAETAEHAPRVGDAYELTLQHASASEGDGSTSSSRGGHAYVERVIGVREDGVEVEFDLWEGARSDQRPQWQFPARVFRPNEGPLRLLNADELDRRVDDWLKAAEIPRAACGRWFFTWTAFQVECDPQTVLSTVRLFDLRPNDLREGDPFALDGALEPAPLRRSAGPHGTTLFSVELNVDPEAVRRERAEFNVAAAQIFGRSLSLEEALREHAAEDISGTISITFEVDPSGDVKRTKTTRLEIRTADGEVESETTTEVIVRRRMGAP